MLFSKDIPTKNLETLASVDNGEALMAIGVSLLPDGFPQGVDPAWLTQSLDRHLNLASTGQKRLLLLHCVYLGADLAFDHIVTRLEQDPGNPFFLENARVNGQQPQTLGSLIAPTLKTSMQTFRKEPHWERCLKIAQRVGHVPHMTLCWMEQAHSVLTRGNRNHTLTWLNRLKTDLDHNPFDGLQGTLTQRALSDTVLSCLDRILTFPQQDETLCQHMAQVALQILDVVDTQPESMLSLALCRDVSIPEPSRVLLLLFSKKLDALCTKEGPFPLFSTSWKGFASPTLDCAHERARWSLITTRVRQNKETTLAKLLLRAAMPDTGGKHPSVMGLVQDVIGMTNHTGPAKT